MNSQSKISKLGEVHFRQKLIEQHLGKKACFAGEPNSKQIIKILEERVRNTKATIKKLMLQNVKIAPFLEIGAEKCQRSSLLASEFNAQGFALDISYESLRSTQYFAQKLNLKKTPTLICADAENLPFADNSIHFVFAYETLHHFPTPDKVLKELKRVALPGGHIFFDEEPIKQILNLNLWRRDYNLKIFEKILKYLLILPFFSTLGASEEKFNVLENTFTIPVWEKVLRPFKDGQVTIKPAFWGPSSHFAISGTGWSPNFLTLLLIAIQGGGITFLGKKEGRVDTGSQKSSIFDLLICPLCKNHLKKNDNVNFICSRCKSVYPIKNKVIFLLTPKIRKQLYPNIE